MDFAATLEYMLDKYEHTNDRFIIGMYVKKGKFNCTQVFLLQQTTKSQVKSSHLYLYSAFNNTNCNKALLNIK